MIGRRICPIARIARPLALTAILLGTGCRPDAASDPVAGTEVLSGRVLYDGDDLGEPMVMAVVGDRLVFTDNFADAQIRVMRLAEGRIEHAFGRKGSGPGEFRAIWGIQPVEGSADAFWIYDPALSRLTRVSLAEVAARVPPSRWKTLDIPAPVPLTGPLWVADTLLASPGLFTEPGRLALLDRRGELLRLVGSTPPGAESVPVQVRNHAYQSMAQYDPDRGVLVLANRHADRIEVLRPDGERVREIRGPARFDPVYRVTSRQGTPVLDGGLDLRFGYVDVETSRRHVYALFSGRTHRERGRGVVYGEEVHVFDWDGRLRRVLRLEGDNIAIAVPRGESRLYALRMHPGPAVVEYDLSR